MREGLEGLLLTTEVISVPGPDVDPKLGQSDGTTPGWTLVVQLECGEWKALTHMFVGMKSIPLRRGEWADITSVGISRELAKTVLKSSNGFYLQGQGPDSVYFALHDNEGRLIEEYLVKPQEITESGIQRAKFRIRDSAPVGPARLLVVWGWRGYDGGFRRWATVRTLDIKAQ